MREARPNYITAALGGIITAMGGGLADKIEINFLSAIIFLSSFFVPIFYLVVDVDVFKGRFKNNGIRAFIFPCNKDEFKILLRLFVWFLSAGVSMMGFNKLF